MRRTIASIIVIGLVIAIVGYSAGLFTTEARKEDGCALCRATRYSGRSYGVAYERVEQNVFSRWYVQQLDPDHGKDDGHPHDWSDAACTVRADPGASALDTVCPSVRPVFLLRPETQLAAFEKANDRAAQQQLVQALRTPDRRLALDRVQRLVEFVHVESRHSSWAQWWQQNASHFDSRLTRLGP
jgi:hypothetical protein